MVTFEIPVRRGRRRKCYFRFSVRPHGVLLAGSRHGHVPQAVCRSLLQQLHLHGFPVLVGCAEGVDRCFRKALAQSPNKKQAFVACAFSSRTRYAHSYGLKALVVVPRGLQPKAALRRRTLWLVKRCCLGVLFPENPHNGHCWGRGSRLVFHTTLDQLKPVFVVSQSPPPESIHYQVLSSDLFGVLQGYWVVPHPFWEGGLCDDD